MLDQTSDFLKLKASIIMQKWEERANNEVLAAFKLESLALRDSLPELLDQIASALSTTIDHTAVRVKWDRIESLRVGKKHGHERAGSLDYTMDQMIFEYHILREVIFDVMEEERLLSPTEREIIICAIEQSVNDAATEFSETLKSIQERLASTLTHDLRGPILAAKINAQVLLRKAGDTEYSINAANQICECMDRLDSMIKELLDASMIRAGEQLPLKTEEYDLNLMIVHIVQEFNLIYGNRFVFVSKPSAKGFWSKNGIRRVVENLATNAIKYGTPDTPITITIGQTDSRVILSIHNEGKPIPLSEQSILFQQFRRSKTAQSKTGWGLGLAIVKGITEAHMGKVRVESIEGMGTTFIIDLPKDARTIEALPDNLNKNIVAS